MWITHTLTCPACDKKAVYVFEFTDQTLECDCGCEMVPPELRWSFNIDPERAARGVSLSLWGNERQVYLTYSDEPEVRLEPTVV